MPCTPFECRGCLTILMPPNSINFLISGMPKRSQPAAFSLLVCELHEYLHIRFEDLEELTALGNGVRYQRSSGANPSVSTQAMCQSTTIRVYLCSRMPGLTLMDACCVRTSGLRHGKAASLIIHYTHIHTHTHVLIEWENPQQCVFIERGAIIDPTSKRTTTTILSV